MDLTGRGAMSNICFVLFLIAFIAFKIGFTGSL